MTNPARRRFVPATLSLLTGMVLLYAVDSGVLAWRLAHGGGMRSVPVEQYLATQLKGEKVEYDYMGDANKNCTQSLFPQYARAAWNPPCWWLEKHRTSWH
jgi:hypothetical protein